MTLPYFESRKQPSVLQAQKAVPPTVSGKNCFDLDWPMGEFVLNYLPNPNLTGFIGSGEGYNLLRRSRPDYLRRTKVESCAVERVRRVVSLARYSV